jgi:FHS family L-fucose permease-like MFS transporter
MIGRLCGSAVISQFKPERVLAIYSLFNVVLVGITIAAKRAVCDVCNIFFMSLGFPTIFALAFAD